MLLRFPAETIAVTVRAYQRPYEDPIAVTAGEMVHPDPARSAQTDILGWVWCRADDGREGWVPEAWLDPEHRLVRDFSALELTVEPGERVMPEVSESGFVLCRKLDGARGWLPDAVLRLESEQSFGDGGRAISPG